MAFLSFREPEEIWGVRNRFQLCALSNWLIFDRYAAMKGGVVV